MQVRNGSRSAAAIFAPFLLVAAYHGPREAGAQELDEHLERLVPFGFSGAALVVENGTVAHAAGYGLADAETGRLNGPETVFDIGSLSKQFTAAAVVLMAERGRLSLADSIGEYLPYVPADKRGITIQHLLTHTSGLPPFHAFGGGDVHGDFLVMSRHGAERAIMGSPLDFPPGEGWTYSNSGYTLLAALVERVAERPFEEVLRSELFEPAGMAHTGLYFEHLWEPEMVARGYRESEDEGSPLEWTESDELWALIGNGGILSSVEDLAKWHGALRDGSVLSRHAVERLFTPHVEVRDGLHYGYGWYVEDGGDAGRIIRHGGANDFGFAARWRRHDEADLLVVLLMNREPPAMDVSLAADAVEQVLNAVARGGAPELPTEVTIPATSSDLGPYLGRYRLDDGGEVILRASLGQLVVEPRGPAATRLLGFPAASITELQTIALLDRRAEEIVDGMFAGDFGPLASAMADSSRLPPFRDYIAGWWEEFERAGGERRDVVVLGTVPSWWNPGDDWLATVIVARVGDRTGAFRLHWRDGRLVGLGGGAVREPATTLFARTGSGEFVGYHLGIGRPVGLSFEMNPVGEAEVLRLETPVRTLTGRKSPR